jgi:hypothetical protein
MLGASRLIIFVSAVALGLGGLFAVASGELGGVVSGLVMLLAAAAIVLATQYERMRYHSEDAEGTAAPGGPGGEAATVALDPRFRPTAEVFVDPSSGRRMRVYADGSTGERRYRAEG